MKMGKDLINCSFSLAFFLFQRSIRQWKSTLKTERAQSEKNRRFLILSSYWNSVTLTLGLNSTWIAKWKFSWCSKRWTHSFFYIDHPVSPATLGWWLQRQPCSTAGCPSEKAPTQVTNPCSSALKSRWWWGNLKVKHPKESTSAFLSTETSPETCLTLGSQEQEMTIYMSQKKPSA